MGAAPAPFAFVLPAAAARPGKSSEAAAAPPLTRPSPSPPPTSMLARLCAGPSWIAGSWPELNLSARPPQPTVSFLGACHSSRRCLSLATKVLDSTEEGGRGHKDGDSTCASGMTSLWIVHTWKRERGAAGVHRLVQNVLLQGRRRGGPWHVFHPLTRPPV